tara:strand:+ start:314 stop:697 length:384 start_codon:yes stop_codon:yes gene_type:complete
MRYIQNPDFMKRAMLPKEDAPSIKNPDGSVSTHRMAAEKYKGDWYAFPLISQQKDGSLKQYKDKDWLKALKANLKNDNVMRFGQDKDSAIAFAKGDYKVGTPMEENQIIKSLMRQDPKTLLESLVGK